MELKGLYGCDFIQRKSEKSLLDDQGLFEMFSLLSRKDNSKPVSFDCPTKIYQIAHLPVFLPGFGRE